MDKTHIVAGSHETVAGNILFTSKVDLGESTISLYSQGCGPATGTGNIELLSTGKVTAQAGEAVMQLSTDVTGQSTVLLDGGPMGSVTIANALPIGNAQSIKMDTLSSSIEISNGNIPGATQVITMDGLSQSIELSAGGLPISPTIQMSPMGIKLSVGPTSSIEITPVGILISGEIIQLNGTAVTSIQGALVDIEASVETGVKGALVMIQ